MRLFREFCSNEPGIPALWIGSVPYRKNVAIGFTKGSVMHTNAYFRSDEDAEHFLSDLREFLNLKGDD